MSLKDKIVQFDPDAPGDTSGGIFGLPFTSSEARIIIVPVPWEVTVSYTPGTAKGPQAILNASPQLDLYDEFVGNVWQQGIAMKDIPEGMAQESDRMRPLAKLAIEFQEAGGEDGEDEFLQAQLTRINDACSQMVAQIKATTGELLDQGKAVLLVGGDHSTPLGYLQALAEREDSFGILQIDAHMDLRVAYEGFAYSHASIMHNALELPSIAKIVQVGVRDFSQAEWERHEQDSDRLRAFTGRTLKQKRFQGISWHEQCAEIVAQLPEKVYLSFDIDGLDPSFCPHTGTPVPGGLDFEEVLYLFEQVNASGRTIIGGDLVEVAPGEDDYDGNVGARILYRMCSLL